MNNQPDKRQILAKLFKHYKFMKKIPTNFKENIQESYGEWLNIIYNKTSKWDYEDLKWVCARLEEESGTLPFIKDFFDIYKGLRVAKKAERVAKDKYHSETDEYLDMESRTLFNIKLLQLITKAFGKTLDERREIAVEVGKYIAKGISENINKEIEDEYSFMIGKGKLYPLKDYIVIPDRLINTFSIDVREVARESFIAKLRVESLPNQLPEAEPNNDVPF